MSNQAVYGISICGSLILDLHALNNEGTEGNQMLTRQVTISDAKGNLHTVNAISGDMLKHIQADHLLSTALADQLPLCQPCRRLDPNRIAADKEFTSAVKGKKDGEVTDEILKRCAVTDMEGILLTEGRSTARPSVIEFGWLVGKPTKVHTESYIHLKRVADAGAEASGAADNLGQNLFHRPASSGDYAVVLHIEAARIGFNDFTRKSPLGPDQRLARYKALLKSVLYTFLEPNGAQRNTQSPHIVGFSGVISYTTTSCPAPTVSPLAEDFGAEIVSVAETLNTIVGKGNVHVKPFASMSEFATEIGNLILQTEPYSQG